jgi:hypothetical protein
LLAWGDDFMQRLFALPFCKGSQVVLFHYWQNGHEVLTRVHQLVLIGIANAGSLNNPDLPNFIL